jgi:hypothetical protein
MAILRGFPPSNTISPSVRIAEKDLSFIAPEQTFHRAGLVGFASKGPINIPTVVRTNRQLHTLFGYPHPDIGDPYLMYAAEQYLLVANELFVVRVADEDAVSDERAKTAAVDIPVAGTQVVLQSDTAGSYVFAKDAFFRWKLNGVLASKTLVVADATYTTTELVAELNDQLSADIDGIEFLVGVTDMLAVQTTFAYGPDASLELVSVQDAIYGPLDHHGHEHAGGTKVTGLGTGMLPGATTSAADRYPADGYTSAGVWDFTGLSNLQLIVVIDGSDNVLIDNAAQIIDLEDLEGASKTTTQVVAEINLQISNGTIPGGFVASETGNNLTLTTLHDGVDARILVKTESTAFEIFDYDGFTGGGTSPAGISGDAASDTYGKAVGAGDVTGVFTFAVTADSHGVDGSSTQIVITNDIRESVFKLEVYNNSVQVEAWGNLTKDASSRFYVESFLTLVSDWVRCEDNTATSAYPLDGTYSLTGGADGIPADPDDQDDLLQGNILGFTGLYSLSEPEQIDIDLIAVPGHASTTVVLAMLDLAQMRGDCLAIIDPPFGLTVEEITKWQNGAHPLNTTRFDSDFGALYWPWLKQRDNFNSVDIWVPPSGSVMAVYARSDQFAEPWYAPAGANRGIVPGISDVYSRPTLEERDMMYGNRNAINPIVHFADFDGFMVWGQKTLQRRPTALDRVNVRRLLFVLEKRIRQASRQLLFDPHDEIFRQRFIDIATAILREVQSGRGLTDWVIQADDELNTPDTIDRNEFHARIGIQPTRAVEFIFIEFSVHRTGSFSENADTFTG